MTWTQTACNAAGCITRRGRGTAHVVGARPGREGEGKLGCLCFKRTGSCTTNAARRGKLNCSHGWSVGDGRGEMKLGCPHGQKGRGSQAAHAVRTIGRRGAVDASGKPVVWGLPEQPLICGLQLVWPPAAWKLDGPELTSL